ncbi:MAG: zinc-binding dehydrogenase, partial [Proteobacteria bacterium]|nr:zinc-binding dehydrogenase [Pseudomonadota bacterium]
FDFIISTVNQKLNWNTYLACLKPRGRLHMVGATLEPLDLSVFNLMKGRKSVSGSPVGSPKNIMKMLDFVAQHKIYPDVEMYKFEQINKAIDAVRHNKVRYRAVVKW